MNSFEPSSYQLLNVKTGRKFQDQGWMLSDPMCSEPSLIRSLYTKKQINIKDVSCGLYRFADWLPISRTLNGSAAPASFHSKAFGPHIGLNNLYITFNGWWPEKGAAMETCSFKETEAYSVCGRLKKDEKRTLVVASAGNTARAFARVCSKNHIPLLLCIPVDNIDAMWFSEELDPCVKLVCSPAGSDYYDAIHLSDIACKLPQYLAEGGAKNIARRDGMGTTVLSASETIGRIPDFYCQAVGSGTGAIAAWEAAMRLEEDGRFGTNNMRIMVSQNHPFVPMYNAWKANSRQIESMEPGAARFTASCIGAKVLSNRKPPYGIAGGLYDTLCATGGDMLSLTNDALNKASALFQDLEGIDIHPAAGIAAASVIQMASEGILKADDVVMLNVTGGGEKLYKTSHKTIQMQPETILDPTAPETQLLKVFEKLC